MTHVSVQGRSSLHFPLMTADSRAAGGSFPSLDLRSDGMYMHLLGCCSVSKLQVCLPFGGRSEHCYLLVGAVFLVSVSLILC